MILDRHVPTPRRWAHRRAPSVALLLGGLVLCGPLPAARSQVASDAAALEFFEKQVRPLLVRRCYECHGPDAAEPKGGLRLDSREAILAGGDTSAAVTPGDPQMSLLVDAINYRGLYEMPPKSKLAAEEIAILMRWVATGAVWPASDPHRETAADHVFDLEARRQAHWCWQPLQTPAIPAVQHAAWATSDLDRFILARLEALDIQPAPRADRRTLIRRAYFDVLGIPPTPEQVAAFVSDSSTDAYLNLVDGLLASPQFGERWARHWMDLVRYAETFGHEFDYPIHHAWRYRDYLIRALNEDVPYDQFVMEHIAGDLVSDPRRHPVEQFNESIIGTGFWFLGEATHAPVDVRGDEATRIDNQIDVMSKTFLGLTVACARCHDHKFDAISTRDYYAFAGYLQSSRRQLALLDRAASNRQAVAAMDQRLGESRQLLSDLAPEADEPSAAWFADRLRAQVAANCPSELEPDIRERWRTALADPLLEQPDHPLHTWRQMADGDWSPERWAALCRKLADHRTADDRHRATGQVFADFSGPGFGDWSATGFAFADGPDQGGWVSQEGTRHQFTRPGTAHSGRRHHRLRGVLRSPTFTIESDAIDYYLAGDGVEIRLIVDGYTMIEFHTLLFAGLKFNVKTGGKFQWHRQAGDLNKYRGHRAHLEVIDSGNGWVAIDEIRFADRSQPLPASRPSPGPWSEPDAVHSIEDLAAAYGRMWRETVTQWRAGSLDSASALVLDWALKHELLDLSDRPALEQLRQRQQEIAELAGSVDHSMQVIAMCDGPGENERVHIRGNHRVLGDEVPRRMPQALDPAMMPADQRGSGRLELARRIIDPRNPLTARVMVNRIWQHLMGRGIVASVDNFGVLGTPPTHPRLLDYLATEFVERGWSIKSMIREIMLSSTYQMASRGDAESEQADPTNRLFHRGNVRRLEGEAIRDAILAISGRLDPASFGPSIPVHLTPFMQGRGRPGKSGPLDGGGRRSIYVEIRRNFLSPMMLAFDTPIPFNAQGRRHSSNVPAQALILMNDPFVAEQARQWARSLLARPGLTTDRRIELMYLQALSREPVPAERQLALEFLTEQAAALGVSADALESSDRVWADLGHVILNLKEFVFLR